VWNSFPLPLRLSQGQHPQPGQTRQLHRPAAQRNSSQHEDCQSRQRQDLHSDLPCTAAKIVGLVAKGLCGQT